MPAHESAERFHLRAPAAAENVPRARRALHDNLLAHGCKDGHDAQLALTEAIANVVNHAYRDRSSPGDFEVEARIESDTLYLSVRDQGCGRRVNPTSSGLHAGLRLMAALSEHMAIEGDESRGTEVQLRLHIARETET